MTVVKKLRHQVARADEYFTARANILPGSSLAIKVKNVSVILIAIASFIIAISIIMVALEIFSLTFQSSRNQLLPGDFLDLIFELGGMSIGVFIFKVALDFRAFKKWAWWWVNLLTVSNWGFMFKNDLQREDMQQAFEKSEKGDSQG